MKKRKVMENSKVREFMFYRTANQVLIDNAMNVASALIGFGNALEESAEEQDKDRVFIRNLLRLPNARIENSTKLMEFHDSMRKDIVRLIIDVKYDLKGAV